MAESETARLLADIHRTLELIALLLAVLVATAGGVATFIGGSAAVLLIVGWFSRAL